MTDILSESRRQELIALTERSNEQLRREQEERLKGLRLYHARRIVVRNQSSTAVPRHLPMEEILVQNIENGKPFFGFNKSLLRRAGSTDPLIRYFDFTLPGYLFYLEIGGVRKIKKKMTKRFASEMARHISAYYGVNCRVRISNRRCVIDLYGR